MKKLNKNFGIGLLTGIVSTATVFVGGMAIKNAMTPTEEFVEAKSTVASNYDVSVDDVSLYRHDDSPIWDEVIDTQLFGDANGLYPNFVYTSSVNDSEKVLAVEIASKNKSMLKELKICGEPIDTYDVDVSYVTDRFQPVYVARINVAGIDNIDSVISGIDGELAK